MSDSPNFPLADMIVEARSQAAIAGLLLQCPDGLVIEYFVPLERACHAVNFELGRRFLLARSTALHAVRDAHGLMPWAMSFRLETLRDRLSRVAAGEADPAGAAFPGSS